MAGGRSVLTSIDVIPCNMVNRQVIAQITVKRNEDRSKTDEGVWIAGSSKATMG